MSYTKAVHGHNRLQECRQIAASRRQRGYTGGGLDLYGEGDAEAEASSAAPVKALSIEDEGEVTSTALEGGDAGDGTKHARRPTALETNENEVAAAAAAPQDSGAEPDGAGGAAAAAEDNGEEAASGAAADDAEPTNAVPAPRTIPLSRDRDSPQAARDGDAEAGGGQQATNSATAADEEEKGGHWLATNDLGCCPRFKKKLMLIVLLF